MQPEDTIQNAGKRVGHRERCRPATWAAEKLKASDVYQDNDLVFCHRDGSRLDPDVVNQTFERLVGRSGLPKIRFHDLRHTHATLGPGRWHRSEGDVGGPRVQLDHHHARPLQPRDSGLGADAATRIAAVVGGA
jgi:integrase